VHCGWSIPNGKYSTCEKCCNNLHNLPNLKQGQNDEEVDLEIYSIVLDGKAHLPGLKERVVSSTIVVLAFIVECHHNCRHKVFICCASINLLVEQPEDSQMHDDPPH
jgi:hypothetical protein